MGVRTVHFAAWMMLVSTANLLSASKGPTGVEETRPGTNSTVSQTSPSIGDGDILRRAQIANDDLYASLRSFVCDESISRTRENLAATRVRKLDVLTTRVSFENGQEQYTHVRQNNVSRAGLSAAGGAWSQGEFGTLLRQTQQLLKTQNVVVHSPAEEDRTPVVLFTFEVSEGDSPWVLVVEGRPYKIPFHTEVVVERTSGLILAVKRRATHIPYELCISEIAWSVKMRSTELAGSSWLLPAEGEYAVSYLESNRRERNVMTFFNYRRYGSEVALRFEPMN